MNILTINMPGDFNRSLLQVSDHHVLDVYTSNEAAQALEVEDYHVIVQFVSEQVGPLQINTLLGLTPISTRIFLVGDEDRLWDFKELEAQGIELLPESSKESIYGLVNELKASA